MEKIGAILTWFESPEGTVGNTYINHARVYYGDRAECVAEANDYAHKHLAGGLIFDLKITTDTALEAGHTIETIKCPKQYQMIPEYRECI